MNHSSWRARGSVRAGCRASGIPDGRRRRPPQFASSLMDRFIDRPTAGRLLAAALQGYADRPDVTVLALPRGGVPVGFEVATALGVPLDVLVVRKLGTPMYPEIAMGAIAGETVRVVNRDVLRGLHID